MPGVLAHYGRNLARDGDDRAVGPGDPASKERDLALGGVAWLSGRMAWPSGRMAWPSAAVAAIPGQVAVDLVEPALSAGETPAVPGGKPRAGAGKIEGEGRASEPVPGEDADPGSRFELRGRSPVE